MKKTFLGVLLGLVLITVFAFKLSYEARKSTSEVDQMQGLYVFVDSKPVMEYEYLGTVKSIGSWDGQYQGVRDNLIRKLKKQYPNADGVIFQFKSGGTDKCDAIKFK